VTSAAVKFSLQAKLHFDQLPPELQKKALARILRLPRVVAEGRGQVLDSVPRLRYRYATAQFTFEFALDAHGTPIVVRLAVRAHPAG